MILQTIGHHSSFTETFERVGLVGDTVGGDPVRLDLDELSVFGMRVSEQYARETRIIEDTHLDPAEGADPECPLHIEVRELERMLLLCTVGRLLLGCQRTSGRAGQQVLKTSQHAHEVLPHEAQALRVGGRDARRLADVLGQERLLAEPAALLDPRHRLYSLLIHVHVNGAALDHVKGVACRAVVRERQRQAIEHPKRCTHPSLPAGR
mmetsp:Transcript_23005/g.54278  ORF Transcript_23005/g.54278 Transcript_23005/m.54278 type:complete len:208 (-) Transcript_23005:22-645(-)